MNKHPIQPLVEDEHGTVRFKSNAIVRYLLDNGPFDMNHLALGNFSVEDREQFAQLIGYSLGGFGELSYVTDETYGVAEEMANGVEDIKDARIRALENALNTVRKGLKIAIPAAFPIHPDDLEY